MSPFIFILGMHAAGTSAVAGLVQRSGIDLDGAGGEDEFHPRGKYESHEGVYGINERILKALDRTWFDPPSTEAVNGYHDDVLEARIRDYVGQHQGLKDPRLCLLLPIWLRHAEGAKVVIVFRRPGPNIESLVRRGWPRRRPDLVSSGFFQALYLRYLDATVMNTCSLPFGRQILIVQFERLIADDQQIRDTEYERLATFVGATRALCQDHRDWFLGVQR